MPIHNPNAVFAPYPAELRQIISIERARESRAWLSRWTPLIAGATPLWSLPGLAGRLGVGELLVKDESVRSPLGSFKALGAPVALLRLVLRRFAARGFAPEGLMMGDYRRELGEFTVISATDGNHGRALAAAAQALGCRCVIVLHAKVSAEREQAIAAQGAEIVRIAGNYDDSVAEAARLAAEHGWQVVSDTSYAGYEEIPRDVMQGYGVLAAEAVEQSAGGRFTHVFLQGGVGGLAAGVASYLWELYGAARPAFIVVEPQQADCLYQSARTGAPLPTSCFAVSAPILPVAPVRRIIVSSPGRRPYCRSQVEPVPVSSPPWGIPARSRWPAARPKCTRDPALSAWRMTLK